MSVYTQTTGRSPALVLILSTDSGCIGRNLDGVESKLLSLGIGMAAIISESFHPGST